MTTHSLRETSSGRTAAGVLLLSASGFALAHVIHPLPAAACSGASCREGSFHLESGAQLPANTPALRWTPPRDFGVEPTRDATLRITRVDDDGGDGDGGEQVAHVVEPANDGAMLVRLPDGLIAGARYRLSVDVALDCVPVAIEVEAVAAAELPQQLGTLMLGAPRRDQVQVATASGSCHAPVPAVLADVDLALAADAEPWAALLAYTTRVDGGRWQPSWSLSEFYQPYSFSGAQTLVFAECAGALPSGEPVDPAVSHEGLAEGRHSVAIEARLPGVERVLRSDSVEVALECGEIPAAEPEDSDPIAGGGEPRPDPSSAPEVDSGRGSGDGGLPAGATNRDGGRDHRRSGDRTYVENPDAAADRGCTVTGAGSERSRGAQLALAGWLAVAGALLARVRRRRS